MTAPSTALPQTTDVVIPAAWLARALRNARLCVGTDATLPVLTCVRLRLRPTDVEVTSTDRYVLLVQRLLVDAESAPETTVQVLLHGGDVKVVLALLAGSSRAQEVRLSIDDDTLEVSDAEAGQSSVRAHGASGAYPEVDAILSTLPAAGTTNAPPLLSATSLARLGRLRLGPGVQLPVAWRCTYGGTRSSSADSRPLPAAFRPNTGEDLTYLIMPVRDA